MKHLIVLLLICPIISFGQSDPKLAQAFKTSYTHENNSEYLAGAKVLENNCQESSYPCMVRTGYLYHMARNYPKSIEFYEKALKIEPNSVEALMGLTYPASNMEDWDKVMGTYLKILEIDPNHSQANYWLGYMYYLREDYAKAQKFLEVVVDLYPFDYDASILLGWVYLKQGDKEGAQTQFDIANLGNPGNFMVEEAFNELEKL